MTAQSLKHVRSKSLSPFELLDCLWKTDAKHLDLSSPERQILSVLITHINGQKAEESGNYVAFPGVSTIADRTGLAVRTVDINKKSLETKGWIKIVTGGGKRKSNRYHIDVRKLIKAYNLTDERRQVKVPPGDAFDTVVAVPSKQERNSANLMQGKHPAKVDSHVTTAPQTLTEENDVELDECDLPPWERPARTDTYDLGFKSTKVKEDAEEEDELGVPF